MHYPLFAESAFVADSSDDAKIGVSIGQQILAFCPPNVLEN
jgi:hypothetical protein